MRIIFSFLIYILMGIGMFMAESDTFILIQNKPVQSGDLVTFTLSADSSLSEIPFIAWDFGDGTGLGRYRRSLTVTYRFTKPGVYQVFARIQGEDIPFTVTQTVYNPIPSLRPTRSSTISIDTLRNLVWVVNPDNNSVSCIDADKNQLVKEIPVGKNPRTIAVDALGNAWVSNEDDASIFIITNSGEILKKIELPFASRPYGLCFDPQLEFCYVTLQASGELLKINTNSKEIVGSLDVGKMPRGIAITSAGDRALVTQFLSPEERGVLRLVNVQTMQIEKEISLAFDHTPDFEDRGRGVPNFISTVSISPDGLQAWIPSKKDNTARGIFRDGNELTFDNTVRTIVSKIDLNSGEENFESRIDINDADMAFAVEFSPYGNIAFIAQQGNNRIAMIDVATNARLGLLDTTGLAPQGLLLNPEGTRLYVHNFMSRTVRVFNTEDIILANNFMPVIEATVKTVTNELLDPEVLLGKQIFYNAADERMTFAGYISCASCHLDGGSDERNWDFTDRGEGFRNTHNLRGRRGTGMGNVHWTSNFDEIQDFENDIRYAFRGKGFLPDEVFNSNNVSDPLGSPKAGLSPELDALAAYVASLDKVYPSPHRNSDGSLTQDALEGKLIFAQANCGSCHSGPDFTDRPSLALHDVGTIRASSGKGKNLKLVGFGTPTLKGIWETAPYLHDGSANTLRDVLIARNHDNKHGDLSGFSEQEIDKLIAYLNQIDEIEAKDFVTKTKEEFEDSYHKLTISPNPVLDKMHIQILLNTNESGIIKIYSSSGTLVYSQKTGTKNNFVLNVNHLKPGSYILNYYDHKSSLNKRFIVGK
jgi:YVTN family beta-propeller protein